MAIAHLQYRHVRALHMHPTSLIIPAALPIRHYQPIILGSKLQGSSYYRVMGINFIKYMTFQ